MGLGWNRVKGSLSVGLCCSCCHPVLMALGVAKIVFGKESCEQVASMKGNHVEPSSER